MLVKMEALGGNGPFWGWKLPEIRSTKRPFSSKSKSSDSTAEATGAGAFRLPLKQAVTAASLVLTGDTIAQLSDRWTKQKQSLSGSSDTTKVRFSILCFSHLSSFFLKKKIFIFVWLVRKLGTV